MGTPYNAAALAKLATELSIEQLVEIQSIAGAEIAKRASNLSNSSKPEEKQTPFQPAERKGAEAKEFLAKRVDNKQPEEDHGDVLDVCIIGAGLAGLTAAERLAKAGLKVAVVEATDRKGGRLRGREFQGRWVEEGANWVQGLRKNPIWQRVKKLKLDGRHEGDESSDDEATVVRGLNKNGKPVSLTDKAESTWEKFDKCAEKVEDGKAGRGKKPDLSYGEALAAKGWKVETDIDMAVEYMNVDFEYAEEPDLISVKHNVHGEYSCRDFGEEHYFVDDPRGFESILPELPAEVQCHLSCPVESVHQTDDVTKVTCKGGKVFMAKVALCTASVGVLNSGLIKFEPPMPEPMAKALSTMTMCNYTKVCAEVDVVPWKKDNVYIVRAGPPRGHHVIWQPMANSKIVMVTSTGDEGRRVEQLPEEELKAELEAALAKMYDKKTKVTAVHVPKWSSNPYFCGAYSFLPTHSMPEGWEVVNEPHKRVFFAGEALHPRWSGYLHGAYGSGEDTAKMILKFLGVKEGK
eukprot:TRINITY_DN78675_c0_g1_i1.p1 TRINITY_DN78675_c0_g1~~TRINITY_DN78675_c0_g1_i1.p1  ORF type:complete len:520 (-),score=106.63 TRINITY_DN78675_c0_g1_i1:236-1795(-)